MRERKKAIGTLESIGAMLDWAELPLVEEDLWLCQGSLSRIGEKSQSSANVVCTIQLLPLAQMVCTARTVLL